MNVTEIETVRRTDKETSEIKRDKRSCVMSVYWLGQMVAVSLVVLVV